MKFEELKEKLESKGYPLINEGERKYQVDYQIGNTHIYLTYNKDPETNEKRFYSIIVINNNGKPVLECFDNENEPEYDPIYDTISAGNTTVYL